MRWRGDLQLNAEAGRNDAVLRNCGRLWTMPQPLTKDAADLMEESGLKMSLRVSGPIIVGKDPLKGILYTWAFSKARTNALASGPRME